MKVAGECCLNQATEGANFKKPFKMNLSGKRTAMERTSE